MNRALHHFVPAVSALLVVIVLVQSVDLVPCADETRSQPLEQADAHLAGNGPHGVTACDNDEAPQQDHHEEGLVDCLCHIAFVSTSQVPEVIPPKHPPAPYRLRNEHAVPGSLDPPEPIPLA